MSQKRRPPGSRLFYIPIFAIQEASLIVLATDPGFEAAATAWGEGLQVK